MVSEAPTTPSHRTPESCRYVWAHNFLFTCTSTIYFVFLGAVSQSDLSFCVVVELYAHNQGLHRQKAYFSLPTTQVCALSRLLRRRKFGRNSKVAESTSLHWQPFLYYPTSLLPCALSSSLFGAFGLNFFLFRHYLHYLCHLGHVIDTWYRFIPDLSNLQRKRSRTCLHILIHRQENWLTI